MAEAEVDPDKLVGVANLRRPAAPQALPAMVRAKEIRAVKHHHYSMIQV